MLGRIFSFVVLAWMAGFIWFAVFLPRPAGDVKTEAVVVLTGSGGRIDRGLEVLNNKLAPKMLVSGVDPDVRPREFAAQYKVPMSRMRCCVKLGYDSVDTRTNANETARWLAARHITSVRLVTSDWHMRRAALDLRRVVPADVVLIEDAVPTQPTFRMLFLEYHKLLARLAQRLWGE